MTNKTFEQKLVLREQGLQRKKEGYVRVIMRESGGSHEFVCELEGSARLSPRYLLFKSDLVTYYVDTYPQQRFRATPTLRSHKSGIKGRSFTLNYDIKYTVSSARKLVTNIDRDPLNVIESELVDTLSAKIEALDWDELLDDHTDITKRSLSSETPDGSTNLWTYLRQFSETLGVELIDISIARVLSESALLLANKIDEGDIKVKLKEIELINDVKNQEWENKRLLKEHESAKLALEGQNELERIKVGNNIKVNVQRSLEDFVERNMSKFNGIPQLAQFVREYRQQIELENFLPTGDSTSQPTSNANAQHFLEQTLSDDPRELLSTGKLSNLTARLEMAVEPINDQARQSKLLYTGLYLLSVIQLDMDKPTAWQNLIEEMRLDIREHAQLLTGTGDYVFLSNLIDYCQQDQGGHV